MDAFLSGLLPSGTTIVTGRPCFCPANATDWPWLPRVAAMRPATWRPDLTSRSANTRPPRTLNAPAGVALSCLTQVATPVTSSSNGQR